MHFTRIFVLAAIFVGAIVFNQSAVMAQNNNWTHFRGNNLDGISVDNQVPEKWNDTTNIIWKTDIHGRGWSSPVIYGNQVWITSSTPDGTEMSGICVDFNSGKILHDILLFKQDSIYQKHTVNTYATPTPCI